MFLERAGGPAWRTLSGRNVAHLSTSSQMLCRVQTWRSARRRARSCVLRTRMHLLGSCMQDTCTVH